MGHSALTTAFCETELDTLQRIFTDVCSKLGITHGEQDILRRERLAIAIMQIATSGETDPGVIQRRALMQLADKP